MKVIIIGVNVADFTFQDVLNEGLAFLSSGLNQPIQLIQNEIAKSWKFPCQFSNYLFTDVRQHSGNF